LRIAFRGTRHSRNANLADAAVRASETADADHITLRRSLLAGDLKTSAHRAGAASPASRLLHSDRAGALSATGPAITEAPVIDPPRK